MKRLVVILLVSICLPAAVQSCRRAAPEEEAAELGLYFECPGVPEVTRASEYEFPGTAGESAIYSLRVWVFNHDTKALVAEPLFLSGSQLPAAGRVRRYSMPVSREFAKNPPRVDVFAVANGASVGCTLDENSTWDELDAELIGSGSFGTSSSNLVRSVPAAGLPMSVAAKNLEVLGEEPVLRLETLALERAVAKLRFIFCRMKSENSTDVVTIDNINMSAGQIPNTGYLFRPNENAVTIPSASGYADGFELMSGPLSPADYEKPESFVYAGQDAVSYQKMIDTAIADGYLSDGGTFYLKESDKALDGNIGYTINGKALEKGRSFKMSAAGGFARNCTWVVYGYFLSGRNLQVSVRALPWDYSFWKVNFSNEGVQADQLIINSSTVSVPDPENHPYDLHLLPGVTAKCTINIWAPVSGKLMIQPKGDVYAFIVEPVKADINPSRPVELEIRRNPDAEGDLSGKYISLSFMVEIGNREIDANTEILYDKNYRFIL